MGLLRGVPLDPADVEGNVARMGPGVRDLVEVVLRDSANPPHDLDYARLFHGVDERVPVDGLTFGTRVMRRLLTTC